MKTTLRNAFFMTLTALAASSQVTLAADNDHRMLIRQRTYGDILGESGIRQTAEKVFYYDSNLNLQRIINTKPNGLFDSVTDYMTYEYNDKGQLKEVAQWQYGVFNYGEWAMKKSNTGNITYTYDNKGNRRSENNDGMVTRYTYNAQNQLTMITEPSGKTISYDKLDANGNPLHAKVRPAHPDFLGDSYEMIYTYDSKGRLVEILSQHDEDLSYFNSIYDNDEVYKGQFVSREVRTYDGDFLKEKVTYKLDYSSYVENASCYDSKTIYTKVTDDIVRYYTISYDEWTKTWSNPMVQFEDEYQDFSDYRDLENQIVSVEQSTEEVNTALVEFTLPQRAYTDPNVGMNVYRNGEFVQTFYLNGYEAYEYDNLVYNEDKTTFTFIDRGLKNGTYEYFVETVRSYPAVAGGVGGGGLDDGLDDNIGLMPLVYVPSYIVSNIFSKEIHTDLPAAENLWANYVQNNATGAVTVEYEMPSAASDYGFISNSLMVDNGQVGETETTSLSANALTCELAGGDHVLYILTRYTYGMVKSEPIIVNVANKPAPKPEGTGIAAAPNPGPSPVMGKGVYTLAGQRLSHMPKGVYIVNGKKVMKSK